MSLFSRSKETTDVTETTTGTGVLQATTKARRFKGHLGLLARDLQLAISDLEAFADGGKQLPPAVLRALAKEFFDAELDVETNKLRSPNRADSRSMGVAPPPYDPTKPAPYHPPPVGAWTGGLSPLPRSPQARPVARPGWAC